MRYVKFELSEFYYESCQDFLNCSVFFKRHRAIFIETYGLALIVAHYWSF